MKYYDRRQGSRIGLDMKAAIYSWMRLLSALLMLAFALPVATTQAQETPQTLGFSDNLSETEFQAMLGRLSDEQVRDILIREFAARRPPESSSGDGLLGNVRHVGENLSINMRSLLSKWPEMGAGFAAVARGLETAGGLWLALLALVVSLGSGFAARFFWMRPATQRQQALAERNADKGSYGTLSIIGDAMVYLLIDLSSVLVFAIASLAALYLFFHNPDLRFFALTFVAVAVVVLVVRSIIELMFPRGWPIYRMVSIRDDATHLLHWLVICLAAIWALSDHFAGVMSHFGAPDGTPELLSLVVSTLWLILALIGIRLLHRKTADLLPARDEAGLANTLTRNWAMLTSGAVLAIWLLFLGGGLLSGAADSAAMANLKLLAVVFGFWALYRILTHYLRARDLDDAIKEAIRRAARAVLIAFGIVIFLAIWGVDAATMKASGLVGRLESAAIEVALTVLIGWAIWDLIRTLIDVRLAAEQPDEEGSDGAEGEGGLGASRSATLLPLVRSFAFVAIGLTCLFTAASSLGVNVAPLIAGAGVIGLAIGFGAQTLVRDIVSGVFFLIDDAFRRGEYIDLGSVKGTGEQISVRSLQLRHHLGAVHTIPFGEIAALTNYSRDWVIMKLPLRLTFDTDPQAVKKLVKRIGVEMMEDELLGPKLLEPPKSQGVIQMEDSAMILRVKFKAIPGEQFVLRRELLHRIRAAFEEVGIRFANREVTVRVNEDASPADRLEAAGAAARQAVEVEQPAR